MSSVRLPVRSFQGAGETLIAVGQLLTTASQARRVSALAIPALACPRFLAQERQRHIKRQVPLAVIE